MNGKLFISTFLLIFLAELGDKTQLAAMARTAASGSKWTIFAAASIALVCSTLIAVLFGQTLTRFVPERVIRITAGILFVLFGLLILREVFGTTRAPVAAGEPGPLVGAVLKFAAGFEESAFLDYQRLAAATESPALRNLLTTLAEEEQKHLERVRSAGRDHATVRLAAPETDALPEEAALRHDVASSDRARLEHAIEHEQATARFYRELANLTPLTALKKTFVRLAEEEDSHVRRLQAMRGA